MRKIEKQTARVRQIGLAVRTAGYGKITDAVNEVMITGNLAEMIQHVVAISKETLAEGTSVMPYLAVDGVVVSGKE